MSAGKIIGLGSAFVLISGCQNWPVGDVESLPPTASLPEVSEPGKVEVRYYDDIPGKKVADLIESPKYPGNPDEVLELTSLEVSESRGDNYGAQAMGYIVPPVSGEYTFFVSGDDETQLWLSTDSGQDNLSLIASVTGWTARQQYSKYSSQTSPVQSLSGDKRYYFEVRLKEASGGDHFSVAWQGPGISQQVIGSDHLYTLGKSPYSDDFSTAEAYSLGYRVGFLDGEEALSFNPDFPPIDEDLDGIYDNWETVHGLDPTNPDDALSDPDQDLLVAADEFLIGTEENNPDTDGDGIPDGVEYAEGLNPRDSGDATEDLDDDGFSNLEEFVAGTDLSDAQDKPEADPTYAPGFVGQYFSGMNFEQFVTARQDPEIDFNWGSGNPVDGLPDNQFSVRWVGQFTAPHDSGARDYRFTARTDDGTRLYLDGDLVVNDWRDHAPQSVSHTESFEPKETVSFIMEYYENRGGAVAQLSITDLSNDEPVSVANTTRVPKLDHSHSQDTDGDGIPDTWELRHGLNPWIDDASEISNPEDVSNLDAYNSGLNPWTLQPEITSEGGPDSTTPEASESEPPATSSVTLSWTAPGTRADGTSISLSEIDYYELNYGQDRDDLAEIQRVDGAETSYQIDNLSSGTWYFTIKVFDTNGLSSPPSEPVSHQVE